MSGRDCVCDGVMLGKTSLKETFSIRRCLAAEMGGGGCLPLGNCNG